jgi:hypothetical protein
MENNEFSTCAVRGETGQKASVSLHEEMKLGVLLSQGVALGRKELHRKRPWRSVKDNPMCLQLRTISTCK